MATGRIGTTPVLRTRWSKEPAGGTTSLSGLDDYSVSLVYEVGYEAVYQNGALLSRGNDYTATDGTTITLTNATVAGDIIEVFANNVVPLTDTYSQSVADGKFVNNTIVDAKGDLIVGSAADTFTRLAVGSANQVLTVDSATTSGLKWATPTDKFEYITRSTFSGSATVTIDNIFSSTYETYAIVFERILQSSNANMRAQFRYGSTTQNAGYYSNVVCFAATQTQQLDHNTTYATLMHNMNSSQATAAIMYVNGVGQTSERAYYHGTGVAGGLGPGCPYIFACWQINTQTYTGIEFTSSAGNLTGEITVYGIRNS